MLPLVSSDWQAGQWVAARADALALASATAARGERCDPLAWLVLPRRDDGRRRPPTPSGDGGSLGDDPSDDSVDRLTCWLSCSTATARDGRRSLLLADRELALVDVASIDGRRPLDAVGLDSDSVSLNDERARWLDERTGMSAARESFRVLRRDPAGVPTSGVRVPDGPSDDAPLASKIVDLLESIGDPSPAIVDRRDDDEVRPNDGGNSTTMCRRPPVACACAAGTPPSYVW